MAFSSFLHPGAASSLFYIRNFLAIFNDQDILKIILTLLTNIVSHFSLLVLGSFKGDPHLADEYGLVVGGGSGKEQWAKTLTGSALDGPRVFVCTCVCVYVSGPLIQSGVKIICSKNLGCV